MDGVRDPLNVDGTETQPEIQPSDETKLASSGQASSASLIAQSRVVTTFKDVLRVTEEKELLDKIEEVNINISIGSSRGIKIRNAPEIMLRNEDFRKYFKPRELSIGPIDAADPILFEMELKLKLVAHFTKRRKRSAKFLLRDLKIKIKDVKACYDDEVIRSYGDDELIWMLFLDGCAMLEFIHSYVDRSLSVFDISNCQEALTQQDLFFLKNQIPLLVLEVLMDSTIKWPCKDNLQNDILRFIFASNNSNFSRDSKDFKEPLFSPSGKPVHVLDLLRYVIVIHDMVNLSFLHSYDMSLPNDQTEKYDTKDPNNSWVTTYVNLLDLLIDNEQRVEDLRVADILRNHLSSDIDAAKMINSIGSYCFVPFKDTYEHIKYGIEKHYRRRYPVWMAQVCHSHFSSPWTILVLLAATAVLALTVVQTCYTVNPKQ